VDIRFFSILVVYVGGSGSALGAFVVVDVFPCWII
jgi:hypothetical protein